MAMPSCKKLRPKASESPLLLLSFLPPTSHHLQILSAQSSKYNQHLTCPCCHPSGTSPLTGVPACDLAHLYSLILYTTSGGTLVQCTSAQQETLTRLITLSKSSFLGFQSHTGLAPPLPVLISPAATISLFI